MLTINQAAERIGISPITLRLQVQRGKIAAERFGRQWMIRAGEVERYRSDVKGKQGFAAETHPFHGLRPPRKGDLTAAATPALGPHLHTQRDEPIAPADPAPRSRLDDIDKGN